MACRAVGLDAFARVPPTDYATIMRPMEAGCSGVMIAQVRTLEEVVAVGAMGQVSAAGGSRLVLLDGRIELRQGRRRHPYLECQPRRWLSIQIETDEAVEIADQIAATEGVDWLFVGPADLSVALGVPGQFLHPKCVAALERVSAACKRGGQALGRAFEGPGARPQVPRARLPALQHLRRRRLLPRRAEDAGRAVC